MKKTTKLLKKIFKNKISIIFVGIFLGLTTEVIAETMIASSAVSYSNSKTTEVTVEGALDDLFEAVDLNNKLSSLEAELADLEESALTLDKTYPVGSIYISSESTNPGVIMGGTWVAYASGRTLVGINTSATAFNTVEKTGGSSTVTLTTANLPSHTHSIPALTGTAASAGAHTHTTSGTAASAGSHTHTVWGQGFYNTDNYSGRTDRPAMSWSQLTVDPVKTIGGAYAAGAHTHTVSGTAASAGAHTHTVSTSTSTTGSTGSASSISVQDPYVVVYMWKRTA